MDGPLVGIFDVTGFPDRWHCGQWTQFHGWVHIVADLMIFSAYFAIPLVILTFVRRRRDAPFPRVFFLFALFILACGVGHLIEAIIFWKPVYRLAAVNKVITAVASWATVLALIPIIPRAIKLPGMQSVIEKLEREAEHRRAADERFRQVVEASPSAMLMVDQRGTIGLLNVEAEKLFGYPRAELLGKPVELLIPERFRSRHADYRQQFFGQPTTRAMGAGRDLHGLRKDGSEVPIEIGLRPLQTAEGPAVLASVIDISERVKSGELMMASLREKEVLLKEVHHRVKNNLAVIGSLFYLQSTTTEDRETLRILRDCQDRVRSMAMVHERLYRSEDLAVVNFGEYSAELAAELLRNNALDPSLVRLEFELDQTLLSIDQAIPCGLILTELVSNALKHAFPQGRSGCIHIGVASDRDGRARICVRDDGVGLPTATPTGSEHSLGMRLVQSLARQLNAELQFRSTEPGTEVILCLETQHAHVG